MTFSGAGGPVKGIIFGDSSKGHSGYCTIQLAW